MREKIFWFSGAWLSGGSGKSNTSIATGERMEPGSSLYQTRPKCPLAQNPQKILNSGIHKHCSMKTPRIREKNPTAWYSNNVRQHVITPNALSQSIK
jgi:hypothetical protein